jgi:tight adherence protein C
MLGTMSADLIFALLVLFIGVAITSGALAANLFARTSPERRRLGQLMTNAAGLVIETPALTDTVNPFVKRLATIVPKSPKEMTSIRRQLMTAGYRSLTAAIVYSASRMICPVLAAIAALSAFGLRRGWMIAILAGFVGVMLPGFWLARQTRRRQKVIRNGLPDALDLLIVCLEAGSSLDQGIVKASDELEIAYPALAEELRLVTTEIRAGKPRLEALKNLAARTKVDDVRALVAMLIQTDRFGTSVAQALRTHADTSRTKRRQSAEERAAKLSVKLVFPLVFFLFPALYVVILGPAVIRIMQVFMKQGVVEALR